MTISYGTHRRTFTEAIVAALGAIDWSSEEGGVFDGVPPAVSGVNQWGGAADSFRVEVSAHPIARERSNAGTFDRHYMTRGLLRCVVVAPAGGGVARAEALCRVLERIICDLRLDGYTMRPSQEPEEVLEDAEHGYRLLVETDYFAFDRRQEL